MIEIPETYVLADQIKKSLSGKSISDAAANTHPHKFAWFTGDPGEYSDKLAGRKLTSANPGAEYSGGGFVEIICEDTLLAISTPIKYHEKGKKLPAKHQLLIEFDDGSHLSCTVQMWGAMYCFPVGSPSMPETYSSAYSPSPLSDEFDEAYFELLLGNAKPELSAKAFLATEQRIPGFGNGVLQDVLFNAKIHPRKKLQSFSSIQAVRLYKSIKSTLKDMRDQGGRDTEKDLYGQKGGYSTIMSAKNLGGPCPVCSSRIVREAYLGGNVYFCPECQPLED
ncbi:MAG: endonuclease VIII [Eubacteriaceae bacterium]|nr:endonuclease VIII [Eubacteriaceae bacterium]